MEAAVGSLETEPMGYFDENGYYWEPGFSVDQDGEIQQPPSLAKPLLPDPRY